VKSFMLVLILITGVFHQLGAQWPSTVTGGVRVQVRLPEVQYQFAGRRGHMVRGRVASLTSDTLYLAVTDSLGPLPIPRRMIERLEFSRGVPSRLASAARRGLISAAAFSLLSVWLNEVEDESDQTSTGTAALIGGGVGLVFGGFFGALYPTERWKHVRLEDDSSAR
jgi:hypothetical protein